MRVPGAASTTVEYATLGWVAWFNTSPSAWSRSATCPRSELEAAYHRRQDRLQPNRTRHSRNLTSPEIPGAVQYYLYCAPALERLQVLPQLLSSYALSFYLGSIARYRPQHFDSLLASPFGGFVQEFLASQPTQFLYLLASDFAKRDITRPPLV